MIKKNPNQPTKNQDFPPYNDITERYTMLCCNMKMMVMATVGRTFVKQT